MQDAGCRMQDAGCRMQDAGCRMQDAGCRMQDAGCRMQDAGCRMQDAGCRMQDAGCRMQDAGCRMQDAGCRMQDAGCKIPPPWQRGKIAAVERAAPARRLLEEGEVLDHLIVAAQRVAQLARWRLEHPDLQANTAALSAELDDVEQEILYRSLPG